jgi:sugar/nucleoside kinase (ribokinase family)
MKVIGIGDNVCDKYVHLKTMFPGGQALNFAVYAKMLGADASYMGVFGRDEVADHVLTTLDLLQVEHGRCRQYEGENGFASVTLVEGDRVFLGSNRGGAAREHPLELTEEDLAYIRGFSHVHTSNNSYFNSQLAKVKSTGVSLSYDFSGRWRDEAFVAQAAPYADYAFLSCGSAPLEEAQEVCRRLCAAGCGRVIATRGSAGALYYDGADFFRQPPDPVEPVDTLGAGDSFATAFLLSFLESLERAGERMAADRPLYEEEVRAALRRGAAFAAKTCLVQGAFGHGKAFLPE